MFELTQEAFTQSHPQFCEQIGRLDGLHLVSSCLVVSKYNFDQVLQRAYKQMSHKSNNQNTTFCPSTVCHSFTVGDVTVTIVIWFQVTAWNKKDYNTSRKEVVINIDKSKGVCHFSITCGLVLSLQHCCSRRHNIFKIDIV